MAQHPGAARRHHSLRLGRKAYPYLSILPVLIVVALFAIYPIIHAVRMSCYKYLLTRPNDHPFVGLGNFIEVITSYYFKNSIQVTAIYTVVKRWAVENGLGFAQLPLFDDPAVEEAFGKWGDVAVISQQAELARSKEGLTPWFGAWDVFTRAEVHKAILGQQTTMDSLNNMVVKWNELAQQ